MQRILALIVVLVIALIGYKLGLDGGQITVLIVILGALVVLLGHLQKKHGAKKILGGAVNGMLNMYDPTLPPLTQHDLYQGMPGVTGNAFSYDKSLPYTEPLPSGASQGMYPVQPGKMDSTVIHEVAAPSLQGMLPSTAIGKTEALSSASASPVYTPLPQHNQYELHLGPNAFIDVQQAFVNTVILDPSGNVVRVLAEELAAKGVPLLFVDVAGTHRSLLGEFPLGWRVCSPTSQQEGTIDPRAIPLDKDSQQEAMHVGRTILQEGWQVLFEFSSYPSPIDAIVTLWDIVIGMTQWEKAQQKSSGRLLPSGVFITEGYRFCPDDNKHSIFRENPNIAQSVRGNIKRVLSEENCGLHWYLATRKITGMDPAALRLCALWMVHQPQVSEVQSGWVTAYTGIQPQDLQLIPSTHTMIMEVTTRVPQLIVFRESHSRGSSNQNATDSTLRTISAQPPLSPGEESTLPFPNR